MNRLPKNPFREKAVFLGNVKETNAVYVCPNNEPIIPGQTPAAYAIVGNGWVGYTGYCNPGKSNDIVLAMCGLE
jgi:hypothetical protein